MSAIQIVTEVNSAITRHSESRNKSDKGQLETTLKTLLKKHFDDLKSDQEKNQLRRKLVLSLHPDKLRGNETIFYSYLESINAVDVPFDCLQNCQTGPGMISQIMLSPILWIEKISNHIRRIAQYKELIEELELITDFQEMSRAGLQAQLDNERAELSYIAPGLPFLLLMGEDLDRYIQPLKFLGNLIIRLLDAALMIAIIVAPLPFLALTMLRRILGFFINLLTQSEYNKRIDAYETSQVHQVFSFSMDALRQQNEQFAEMNDDEIFDATLPKLRELPAILGDCQSKEEYLAKLKSEIHIRFLVFFKCSFGALWHSFTHAPEGLGSILLWVLTWIPRLALGLVLGIVGTALEAAKAVVSITLTLGTLLLAFIVRSLTLLALNLPLYLLVDFPRAIARFFCGDERRPTEPRVHRDPLHTSRMPHSGASQGLDDGYLCDRGLAAQSSGHQPDNPTL